MRPRISFFAILVLGAVYSASLNFAFAQAVDPNSAGSPWKASISRGPKLPLGRSSQAAGYVNGHVIVAGGTIWNKEGTIKSFLDDSIVYSDGGWTPGPKLPVALAEGAFASDGRAFYLAGGMSSAKQVSDVVCKIIPQGDGFQMLPLPSLPSPLSCATAAVSGDSLYVACGSIADKESAELWSLNLSKSDASWVKLADLPASPRLFPALAACGDGVYLLGGMAGGTAAIHDRSLSDVWRYDIGSNQWNQIGTMPVGGYYWSAESVDAGHLLLGGRADGKLNDDLWLVDLQPFSAHLVGKSVIPVSCAPLVRAGEHQWWLIGGEHPGTRQRTDIISAISLR